MSFFEKFMRNNEKDLSFLEILSSPLTDIFSHLKEFIILAAMVSLITSVVTFFGGRGFFCGLGIGDFCSYNIFSFVLSVIVNLYAMAFFINRWDFIIVQKMSLKQALSEKCWVRDLKTVGIILFYLFLWGIIGFCGYMLQRRVATDDFGLELGFFVFFSGIIIFCLLFLLNFVGFYHYLHGNPFFTFHKTIGRVCDNLYALFFVFFIYLLICIVFIYNGETFLSRSLQNGWVISFLGEIYFYFMVFTGLAVFVSSLAYQEKKLFTLE